MTSELAAPLAVACARAALDGDERTLCRLLAMATMTTREESKDFSAGGWFGSKLRSLFGKRIEPESDDTYIPHEDVEVLDDEMFLPWAEELPDDEALPIAHELTPTELAIFNNEVIHVRSSWIEEWHYDGPKQVLYVLVKGPKKRGYMGKEYPLGRVSFKTVMGFYHAISPGRYFIDELKGKYPSGGEIQYKRTSPGPNIVTKLE